MTSGFNINPDEVHSGANSLSSFADEASGHLDRLSETSERVSAHARGDRSGVGKVIEDGVTKATTVMADTGKQIIRVVKGSSDRLHAGTDAHVENEDHQKGVLDGIHPKDEKVTAHPEEGGSSSTSTSSAHTPHEPPKPKGEDATPPLREENKPPSATNNHSQEFKDNPNLPKPEPFHDPLPTSDRNSFGMPPDKARGAKIEQLTEDRVTRDKDGLISHIDGKPVKQYINDLSKQKATDSSDPSKAWMKGRPDGTKPPKQKNVPGKEGVCSAVAIDRRTGLVTHGINGKRTDVVPYSNLHPLLQQNIQNLRGWDHEVKEADGTTSILEGKAHPSIPANHAEVKAVNELLWDRQSKLPEGQTLGPDTMKEIAFDPRWTATKVLQGEAPACANCNTILHGAESYTGRYQYAPLDTRYKSTMLDH